VTDLARVAAADADKPADLAPTDTTTESSETKGERTRRRLLEIAIDRFGSRGFKGTSVSEIARAAGLTQAASYAYFENKEALFRAAVDADASALIDEVSARVAGVPPRHLIPSVIVYALAALGDHPLARRVLRGLEPDEVPRLVGLPALERFGQVLAAQIAAGRETGEVRADLDPEKLAGGLESLILGVLFNTVLSGGQAQARHVEGVAEAFDLMIRPSS
jgi:AcrR family transcriptional regulator